MAELLALEWDAAEARVVVAAKHAGRTVIERAFAIPLGAEPSAGERAAADIGRSIAEGLAERGLARCDALVAVGRGSIQLREFQLPAVPDEELPEMVHLQAVQELSELDDSWLLDFMPIEAAADSRTVLAAAMGPELTGQVRAVCEAAGLRLRRIVLRACEAASLLGRVHTDPPDLPRLLIDLLDGEADLTAMAGSQVVYLRTTRLHAQGSEQELLAQIRHTMAAVHNRLGGRQIESVVFYGLGEPQATLARTVHESLDVRTELFDPFSTLELGPEFQQSPPAHPGRFAALVGALAAELDETPHAIDFLHPRRAPLPPSRRKKWIAAAAAAAVLLLAWLVYARIEQARLVGEIDRLTAESAALEKPAARADKIRANAAEISKWADGDIVWLDHFRVLSEHFPPAQGAIVNQLTFGPTSAGPEMNLRGQARDAATIGQMEQQLRSRWPRVISRGSREDSSQRLYSWRFETSVIVGREAPE
jgi:hypothetical protein